MRKRPPSKLVTYLEITRDPPPFSSPTIDTYAALDHVLCRMEHQHCFCSILSLPHLALPWHHRHFLISAIVPLPFFHSPKPPPPPPKRDFSPNDSKLAYQTVVLSAFGLPSPPSNMFAPFHIYTDGSCPDLFNISLQNPAAWGVFYESNFRDLYGTLPFPVNGSNNTAELQAPPEAIAFMLLRPPLPLHPFPSRLTICSRLPPWCFITMTEP